MANPITKITKRVRTQPSWKPGWKKSKKSRQQHLLDGTCVDRDLEANGSEKDTIDEGLWIPSRCGIVFYGDGVDFGMLPDYKLRGDRYDRSFRCYLTFVDCHQALVDSMYKARLILFELKRRAFSLKSGKIVLEGTARRLDEELVQDVDDLKEKLVRPRHAASLLGRLLSTHLRLHPRYELESARLQASLLRMDKTFRTNVVEPLKSALIDTKNKPDYGQIQSINKEIQGLALAACSQWYICVGTMCDEIMASSAWKQAEELAARILALEKRAKQHGWNEFEEKAYQSRVGPREDIFDTAEGPNKAIAYLEDWCQKAET